MYCKHCGKALGTDRGICPFCGAMLSMEQMKEFNYLKKEKMYKAELLTEKYGGVPMVYAKNEKKENKILGFVIVSGVLLLLVVLVFLIVLN